MTLIMRDSVTPNAIPLAGTQIAAGYIDGGYEDIAQLAARFPHVPKVLVDVNGIAPGAQVRDWETGDKAGNLADWVEQHNAYNKGFSDAVVYCNRSTIAEVRDLTGKWRLNHDYFLWIATGDGTLYTPDMLPGVVACQDKWSTQTHANYDESVVWTTKPVAWTGYKSSGYVSPVVPAKPHQPVTANVVWQGDAGVVMRKGVIPWDAWTQIAWEK